MSPWCCRPCCSALATGNKCWLQPHTVGHSHFASPVSIIPQRVTPAQDSHSSALLETATPQPCLGCSSPLYLVIASLLTRPVLSKSRKVSLLWHWSHRALCWWHVWPQPSPPLSSLIQVSDPWCLSPPPPPPPRCTPLKLSPVVLIILEQKTKLDWIKLDEEISALGRQEKFGERGKTGGGVCVQDSGLASVLHLIPHT